MNPAVVAYIEGIAHAWQVPLAQRLRSFCKRSAAVEERRQYRKPHDWKNGNYAAVISSAQDAISLTMFNAATLGAGGQFVGRASGTTNDHNPQ